MIRTGGCVCRRRICYPSTRSDRHPRYRKIHRPRMQATPSFPNAATLPAGLTPTRMTATPKELRCCVLGGQEPCAAIRCPCGAKSPRSGLRNGGAALQRGGYGDRKTPIADCPSFPSGFIGDPRSPLAQPSHATIRSAGILPSGLTPTRMTATPKELRCCILGGQKPRAAIRCPFGANSPRSGLRNGGAALQRGGYGDR